MAGVFTRSQKGGKKLSLDGNTYSHNKQWDSETRETAHCRATITTDADGNVIRRSSAVHSHSANKNRAEVLDTSHRLRSDAVESVDASAAIISRRVLRSTRYVMNIRIQLYK